MVKSALNWAAGFFGIPYEDQFELELIIETPGLNNTFAPSVIITIFLPYARMRSLIVFLRHSLLRTVPHTRIWHSGT